MNLDNYVDVAERIQEFKAKFPEGSLQPLDPFEPYRLVEINGVTYIHYAAAAYRSPEDTRPGIGMVLEIVPGRTPYTQYSELAVAETSAWGRALAALGFATKRIATAQEVRAAESRRVERISQPSEPIKDPWNEPLMPKVEKAADIPSCRHGERLRKSGTNAKGKWVGWYCPTDRQDPDRCSPIFEGQS